MEVSCQFHAPAALPPEIETPVQRVSRYLNNYLINVSENYDTTEPVDDRLRQWRKAPV
jgi:hypothetical protein